MKSSCYNVGFIGLGRFGSEIAAHISQSSYPLYVWNRTYEKAQSFHKSYSCTLTTNLSELAQHVEIVFMCVTDNLAAEEVINSIISCNGNIKKIIDHSTLSPITVKNLYHLCAERGISYVDIPLTGSIPKAKAGELIGFAGCRKKDIIKYLPLLKLYCKEIKFTNQISYGQIAKLSNQIILLNMLLSTFEAVNFLQRSNSSNLQLEELLKNTIIDCPAFRLFASIASNNAHLKIAPLKNVLKDLTYIRDFSISNNTNVPISTHSMGLMQKLVDNCLPDSDIDRIIELFN